MSARPAYASYSQVIGDLAAGHALLNCLIKEFALPLSLLDDGWRDAPLGLPFQLYRRIQSQRAAPLSIQMPDGTCFLVLVDRRDTLGSQYYVSGVFGKRAQGRWQLLSHTLLAEYVLESGFAVTQNRNPELLTQILASREGDYETWSARGVRTFVLGDERGIAFRALQAKRSSLSLLEGRS